MFGVVCSFCSDVFFSLLQSTKRGEKHGKRFSQTLPFLRLNSWVKSVSSSSILRSVDDSVGLAGERCAQISGIYRVLVLVFV